MLYADISPSILIFKELKVYVYALVYTFYLLRIRQGIRRAVVTVKRRPKNKEL
jgi:hypothetical protein